MTPATSDDLAELAERVMSAWTKVSETDEDLAEFVTEETFLGIQYARLHADGVVRLMPESREVLEKAHQCLVGIL